MLTLAVISRQDMRGCSSGARDQSKAEVEHKVDFVFPVLYMTSKKRGLLETNRINDLSL